MKKGKKMVKKKSKKIGKIKGFSLQFLPYSEIKNLDSDERIKKILKVVLGNKILILQGKLTPQEEARLIGDTMAMIGYVKNFKGVELAVISPDDKENFFKKIKRNMVNVISGWDLDALTIVGPASIVKEIKRNPSKIELLLG